MRAPMSTRRRGAVTALAEDLELVPGNAEAMTLRKDSFQSLRHAVVEGDRSTALGTDQVVVSSRGGQQVCRPVLSARGGQDYTAA